MGKTKELARTSTLDGLRENARQLKNLSWDQVEALAADLPDEQMLDASQLGDGFTLLDGDDKKHLIGVPFAILDWDVWPSKDRPGTYFTSMILKTKDPVAKLGGGTDFRINDGSTGIHRQLKEIRKAGFTGLIRCMNGLRVSEDYVVTQPKTDENGNYVLDEETGHPIQEPVLDPMTGKEIHGTTYYLDTAR